MNICPTCKGEKVLRGFGSPGFKPIEMPCHDCKGDGVVSDERMIWKRDGERLRKFREVSNLSARAAAKWADVKPSEWSDAEHGRVNPHPIIEKVRRLAIERARISPKLYHMAGLLNTEGGVSAYCRSRTNPRALNLRRELWALRWEAVTCQKCLARRPGAPAKEGE